MVKTTIKETTEKFDKDGKLFEKIIREETSEDDSDYNPTYITPSYDVLKPSKWNPGDPYCGYSPTEEYKREIIEKAKSTIGDVDIAMKKLDEVTKTNVSYSEWSKNNKE